MKGNNSLLSILMAYPTLRTARKVLLSTISQPLTMKTVFFHTTLGFVVKEQELSQNRAKCRLDEVLRAQQLKRVLMKRNEFINKKKLDLDYFTEL
jgi:hypothetical protein